MIKNHAQRAVTARAVVRFERSLVKALGDAISPPPDVHPKVCQAVVDAIKSELAILRAELDEYDDVTSEVGVKVLTEEQEHGGRTYHHAHVMVAGLVVYSRMFEPTKEAALDAAASYQRVARWFKLASVGRMRDG